MDFLIEVVLDLVFEGGIELSKNRKVPKIIRYPLIVIILLFFAVIIIGLFIIGVVILKQSVILGIIMIASSIVLLVSAIVKFRNVYLRR